MHAGGTIAPPPAQCPPIANCKTSNPTTFLTSFLTQFSCQAFPHRPPSRRPFLVFDTKFNSSTPLYSPARQHYNAPHHRSRSCNAPGDAAHHGESQERQHAAQAPRGHDGGTVLALGRHGSNAGCRDAAAHDSRSQHGPQRCLADGQHNLERARLQPASPSERDGVRGRRLCDDDGADAGGLRRHDIGGGEHRGDAEPGGDVRLHGADRRR